MIINTNENNNIHNNSIIIQNKSNTFDYINFIYIMNFWLGIFFLYVAYGQFCLLTAQITGNTIDEVNQSIQSEFNNILFEYEQEWKPPYIGSKITLFIRVISGHFSQKIYYSLSEIITRFLNENIRVAITQSIHQCQINVFDDNKVYGKILNMIASTTSGITGEYTNCLNSFTHRNIEHVVIIQNQKLQDLLTLFKMTTFSIVNFTRLGSGFILSSGVYFIYKCSIILYNGLFPTIVCSR